MSSFLLTSSFARRRVSRSLLVDTLYRSESMLFGRNSLSLRLQKAEFSRYAKVDHSEAYQNAMKGRHGKQLELATIDGIGKDDPPYDPFLEYELDQEREKGNYDYDDEYDEDEDDDSPYNNDGSLRYSKSQLAEFRAGAPAGGKFAIIELAGTQHKITVDDVIVSNRLKPVETYSLGSVHTFKDVLLVGSSHLTLVGMPTVSGAEVDVMVEEITRDEKVIVFKKRRRKHSKRKNGFRRDVTMLRVLDIRMPQGQDSHDHVARVQPDVDNELYEPAAAES